MRLPFVLSIAVLALAPAACSSTTVTPDAGTDAIAADTPATDTPAVDSPVSDAPVHDASTTPCPPSPGPGTCSLEGLLCTYGDDPRVSCRTRMTCTSGNWQIESPRCIPPGTCTPTPVQGAICANDMEVCVLTDGTRCNCAYCPPFGPACMPVPPAHWFCSPPPTDTNCPRTLPNLGASCSPDGTTCNYDGCGQGMAVRCSNGYWVPDPVPCPA